MNERLKELRKALGLSGEKFGESLGITRFAISQIETGKNKLTDQMVKLICLAYNVREEWLRTGKGEMFRVTQAGFLSDLTKELNLSSFDVAFLESYISLTADERAVIKEFITSCRENPDEDEI